MGKPSRSKGKLGEREVVLLAREVGFEDARRDWMTPQNDGDVDLGEEYRDIYLEVRRRETLAIPAWCKEVEGKAGDRLPVVAFRRSNEPWRAALPLDRLLRLIKRESTPEVWMEAEMPDG